MAAMGQIFLKHVARTISMVLPVVKTSITAMFLQKIEFYCKPSGWAKFLLQPLCENLEMYYCVIPQGTPPQ